MTSAADPALPTHAARKFALFNLGFRPFYLLAGCFATISIPLWLVQYFSAGAFSTYLPAMSWHAHEMVFGFGIAVISGFLFTAVRNWTKLPTPTGTKLMMLALLWLLGRILMLTGPALLAALIDILFLPLVAWSIWIPIKRSGNTRNLFFVGLLMLLATINLIFHLSRFGILDIANLDIAQGGLYVIILIISVMGGRVIPSFTGNAIPQAVIRRPVWIDRGAIVALILALASSAFGAPAIISAPLCFIAALLHALRLAGWAPLSTVRIPILWILHASYAWIPLGLFLLGLSQLTPFVPETLAVHAFSVGAMGGMILGMMTRTARGHTGRMPQTGKAETIAYSLVQLAAISRVVLGIVFPQHYALTLGISGLLWTVAYLLFTVLYWPILSQPRIDGKPG